MGATFAGKIKDEGMKDLTLTKTYLNKHVAAIHCSNNISLLQRKIYNALLYNAYQDLLKEDFHYISLSELSKLISYNSKDTAKLKLAFKKLQSTTVEWNIIENGGDQDDVWCSSTLLASSVIDKKRGYCRYEYSKTLASLLFQPDVYARIDLRIQNRFRSSYGLALYENCIRYYKVRTTGWIKLATFKKLMGINESKYPKFSDLNRRVISSAIDEINEISDITVDLKLKRVSQQVISLKFDVSKKKKAKPLGIIRGNKDPECEKNQERQVKLHSILQNKFHASGKEIDNLFGMYPIEYIMEKVEVVFSSAMYKQGKINSPIAYLKSALRDDYSVKNSEIVHTPSKKSDAVSDEQKNAYERYRVKYILDNFYSLPDVEGEKIKKAFCDYYSISGNTADMVAFDVYKKQGVQGVSIEFSHMAAKQFPGLLDGLLSIEEFVVSEGR